MTNTGSRTRTAKPVTGPTDLDYDVAQLGDPLTADALDALDGVIDARDAVAEFANLITLTQTAIEDGKYDEALRDQIGSDLLALAAKLSAAAIEVFG